MSTHDISDEEIYCCPSCGHEDHADKFGANCPSCGVDLDELEEDEAAENEEG